MPTPSVIDLSHHNTIPQSLVPAKDAGIVGVIHKLTEGTSYTDDKVQARYALAKDAGMAWGVYHFVKAGSATQQAEFFLDQGEKLGVIDDDTCLVLDWEVGDFSADQAVQFLEYVQNRTGRSPMLYSGHTCKEDPDPRLGDYRLWLAQYSSSCTLPSFAEDYWLWQYSQEGSVPGVSPPTDVNQAGVPLDQLLVEWAGDLEPEPVPVPEITTVIITIEAPPNIKFKVNIVSPEA